MPALFKYIYQTVYPLPALPVSTVKKCRTGQSGTAFIGLLIDTLIYE